MKISAKIYPKYLDEILSGKKTCEYRQIESITLDDGARVVEIEVTWVSSVGRFELSRKTLENMHPDVKFDKEKDIVMLGLGAVLSQKESPIVVD